jgi:polyhydroxyalkanoate synthesis regulator phasin
MGMPFGRWLRAGMIAAVLLLPTHAAQAFGLKTHLWIAQRVLDDILPDCAVTLSGGSYAVPQDLCDAIRHHPGAFLAGALGPDAYPDLINGQVTAHPGIEGDWQTADWLKHLHRSASAPEEVAFSSGYLTHAAGDTFAHTYVNAYAGDVFALGDERAVERRHFVLEKYIDYRLPAGEPDPNRMRAPAAFLAGRLILNRDAARVSAKSGMGAHISAMYGVYVTVDQLARQLDSLEDAAGGALANVVAEHVDLTTRFATGEAQLKLAREGLSAAENILAEQERALEKAQRELDNALQELASNADKIAKLNSLIAANRDIIEGAGKAIGDVNSTIADLQQREIKLTNDILQSGREVCEWVSKQQCKAVCLGGLKPVCKDVCEDVLRQVCRPAEAVIELNKVRGRLLNEQAKLNDLISRRATAVAAEAAAQAEKAQAQALRNVLEGARQAAQITFDAAREATVAQRNVVREARAGVDALKAEIERLRQKIVDTASLKDAIQQLVAQSNVLSGYARHWRTGIEVASREYINAALKASTLLASGQSGVLSVYAEWLTCYGSAFTPVPYELGQYSCSVLSFLADVERTINEFLLTNLPPPFDELFRQYLDVRQHVQGEVKRAAGDAVLHLAKLASPDATTADLIDLMANPNNATAGKLSEVFSQVGDAGGKPLLTFDNAVQMIDADVGLSNGRVSATRFAALRHAVTLSKLALLNESSLREVVYRTGGDVSRMRLTQGGSRFSVLYEALRSIDGNHQWQPYGLPYPSANGAPPRPADPQDRRFGYGPADGSPAGMPLFVEPQLRSTTFATLFPKRVAGGIAGRPEMRSPAYPFPECDTHPFPVAFNPDGTPASNDLTCNRTPLARGTAAVAREVSTFGNHLKRAFRRVWAGLGFKPWVAAPAH